MVKVNVHQLSRIVELSEFVKVRTTIAEANWPALRSGFAGYPLNPRWNASKAIAWKTGRQWKLALENGTMAVRSQDGMLVPTSGDRIGRDRRSTNSTAEEPPSSPQRFNCIQSLSRYCLNTPRRVANLPSE
ncbi:MAG: hypothetical protein SW833_09620 [Cyanobacteriota bacterium]|nr:hypothetical protein [Cyanobacteriota bacterium]